MYYQRLKALQEVLKKSGCEGFILEEGVNLYYLTGQNLSSGKLLIHPKGAFLLVDGRYYSLCQKTSPFPVILEKTPYALFELLASDEFREVESLGFDSSHTSYNKFLEWKKGITLLNEQKRENNPLSLEPLDNPLMPLRIIKEPEEIDKLRQAAILGSEGYDYARSLLKEGILEQEVAMELEIFWKRCGAKGVAFDPIIAFGPNSAIPHYRAGNNRLQKGQTVLIDIGVNLDQYHSDMTRVLFFGDPDPKLVEIYEVVRRAQERALKRCHPGTLIGDLDKEAREEIANAGYGEYFTHSLGHGVGLEIHETPFLRSKAVDQRLEAGMVITIEPGIYLPGFGGVRIEDTVVITKDSHENLTNRPKNLLKF